MPLHAQNQLVPAPDAVKLRRVWIQRGEWLTADNYGYRIWGGVDISGDSINDFAVYRGSTNQWLFYRGAWPSPDTTHFHIVDDISSSLPTVGDYYDNGKKYVGLVRGRAKVVDGSTIFFSIPGIYEVASGAIAHTPIDTMETRAFKDMQSANLDGEPGDELIIMRKFDRPEYPGEILIYKGGSDFRLDTPTVIIKDTGLHGSPDNWNVQFCDLDGDGRLDLAMGGVYPGVGEMLRFYWSNENSPWSWAERQPDRDIPIVEGTIGLSYYLNSIPYLEDYDGDGVADLDGSEFVEGIDGVRVYLSSRKNARTRSFTLDDADIYYPDQFRGYTVGPLNDSLGKHDMLALVNRFVSGSPSGPDFDYEAYYSPDGLDEYSRGRGMPVGDVTDDGWPDLADGHEMEGPAVNTGVAMVLAGGPYIPFDDPSMVVEEYPIAGESTGLYLWPNPVDDELHIAWKGNLKRMPARFEIHDMNGELTVEGEIDSYRGEAVWRCAGVAAGTYLLTAYDNENNTIADARIIKR